MPRYVCLTFAGIILGLLVGVPLAYGTWHASHFRNFHVVREGVLYRSGQLSLEGLKRVVHDHGIKTVITFRSGLTSDMPAPDADEERFCRQDGLHYFRLPMRSFEKGADSQAPAQANVDKFLEILADPGNHPVLVHCFAGIHRTGQFCAIYRMEFEHWDWPQALQEMREIGYTVNHTDVFNYLENYQRK